jgi:hypothetical protein
MQQFKSAFHLPPNTCHVALMQELGVRPMSIWFDMHLLELWHRVTNMQDSRLVKKIVLAAPGGRSAGGRSAGGRQMHWMDKVKAALKRWERPGQPP